MLRAPESRGQVPWELGSSAGVRLGRAVKVLGR
jgi:hypothetical protein